MNPKIIWIGVASLALLLCVAVQALSGGRERYHIVAGESYAFKIDTVTGQTWFFSKWTWYPVHNSEIKP